MSIIPRRTNMSRPFIQSVSLLALFVLVAMIAQAQNPSPLTIKLQSAPKGQLLPERREAATAVFDRTKVIEVQPQRNKVDQKSPVPPSPLPATILGWQTIMTETFEGQFPNTLWTAYAGATYTNAYWDDKLTRPYAGLYSAWCAGAGTQQGVAGGNYPDNMKSWMIYGPFSLSDATDADLEFYYWNESETDYDYFGWYASVDGTNFSGYRNSGTSPAWTPTTFDLKNVPTLGNLMGKSQVWIAFVFTSDASTNYRGAFVDNIVLQKNVATTTPAISLSSSSLSFGSINVGASSQQSLTVSNTGNAALNISSISSSSGAFAVSPTSFSVSAGGAQTVIVTFTPSVAGSYSGTITINHNASGSPTTVSVTGTGVSAPKTETEPNNTASQANSMVYGDSLNASISPSGDVDYYKFNASAGDTVEIYSYNINSSLLDGMIMVFDGTGNSIGVNDDFLSTYDSRVIVPILSNGTYYVRYSYYYYTSSGIFPNGTLLAKAAGGSAETETGPHGKQRATILDLTGDYRLRVRRFVPSAPLIASLFYGSTNVYSSSAWIITRVFPNGSRTTVRIEYGLTTAYGQSLSVGTFDGLSSNDVTSALSGLSPGSTYHYRVVATNNSGTVATSDRTFTTPSSPQGWTSQSTGTSEYLIGVCFSDAQTGTAVGTSGTIIRTTNGGTSWTTQNSGVTNQLNCVSFVGTNVGTVGGLGGTILRTTNGGLTWTQQTSGTTNNLRGVYFTDANTGTAVGASGTILRTTNGGATWISQSSGTTNTLNGVSFTSSTTGTVVGSLGTILRTTNGGTTWVPQSSGVTNTIRGVWFTDANTGTGVGYTGWILRTTNGGTTWTAQTSGTTVDLYGVAFSDVNTGVAIGLSGTVLRTTNGGATWTGESSGTFNSIYGISYASNTFNVVGDYGMSLRCSVAATAPAISLSSSSLSFGSINVGASSQQSLTISNTGTAALSISSITSTIGAFTVSPTSFSVAAGGNQTVTVTFAPSAATSYSGTITINHNASGSPTTVSVTGTGVAAPAPAILVSATSLVFGTVNTGTSTQKTFTVSNSGTATLNVSNITSTNGAFSVSPTSFSIPSGGSPQTVTVSFTPTALQTYSATLSVAHNASGSPSQISLTGTGAGAAVISLTISSLSFGPVNIGSSASQTLNVTNSGNITLTVTSLTSNNGSFAADPTSFTLSPAGTQVVTVTFTPSSGGTQSSTFTFASNAATNPAFTASGVGETRLTASSTQAGRFNGGIPPSTWVLMSIPYKLDNTAASTLSSQLSGDTPWKLYTYQTGQNVEITNASDAFTVARGLWFKTTAKSASFNLSFGSGDLIGGSTYALTIPSGWSLVGPPFVSEEASWTPVNTTPGSAGIRVYKYLHENNAGWQLLNPAVERMKPYGGYAVYNGTGAAAAFTFVRNGPLTSIQEWQPGDGWYGVLAIGETNLRIGQHRMAYVGEDALDYPMPPPRPDSDSQEPYVSEELWSDIKPVAENAVTRWKITVDPRTNQCLKLQELVGLPEGWGIMVDGIPNQGALKLKEGEEIHFSKAIRSPIVMTVLVGPAELVEKESLPTQFVLYQNYPNPFNPTTAISYQLAANGYVTLKVFDVLGREVARLVNEQQPAGTHDVRWDASGMPSGMYLYRITAGNFVSARKMVLTK